MPTTSTPTGTPPTTSQPASSGHIVVYLDGWSAANLDAIVGIWQADGIGAVNVVGSSARDLTEVDSRVVTQLAARLVTSDPTLVCTEGGCVTATGPVPDTGILDPGGIGGFGRTYRRWGIETGVWKFTLPGTAGTLTIGDGSLRLTSDTTELVDNVAGPHNGWRVGQYALGYAFGRLFTLDAGWLRYDDEGTTSFEAPAPAVGTEIVDIDPTILLHGLGTPVDAVGGMNTSMLTYLSSPTTGCYIGVLCVPGTAAPQITVSEATVTDVCDADGHVAQVHLAGIDITYDYPAPTHQFGMWNGTTADGVFNDGTSSNLWASSPPLIDGSSTQHHAVGMLVDAAGIAAVTGGAFQIGVDDPEYDHFAWKVEDISRLFTDWVPCS